MANTFVWYELMTSDVKAAEAFYSRVLGWTGEGWGEDGAYRIMSAGSHNVAGLMTMPDAFKASGGHPCWVGYVGTDDVDAAAERLRAAGGQVQRPPEDIPEIGRFAVVADPQGAMFMLFSPKGDPEPAAPAGLPGTVGWHELYAEDWTTAFDFYAGQFGWTKGDSVDIGPMGTYQLFVAGGVPIGGMMNRFESIPRPVWGYYFNVPGIEAAAEAVRAGGGKVFMEPHQVPGGGWIVNCSDPQGAHVSFLSQGR